MRSRSLAVVLAVALAPLAARAHEGGWDDDSGEGWSDVRPAAGYDVSVELGGQGGVTLDTFDGPLQPYGQWVVVGNHGRVWRPSVPAGWRPYYYGRWEWTNEGWLWVSDEPWGWATYHYGRWTHDPYYGWIWVPGTEWAPAWVSWRSSGDVIGWAPLAPGYSVYVSTYPFVDFWWTFVPCTRFVSVPVYSVAYAPHLARNHFHATAPSPARPPPRPGVAGRVVSGTPAWGGPAPRLIEERIGRRVAPARIVAAPAPGARTRPGEVGVYRPDRRAVAPSPAWGGADRGVRGAVAPQRGGDRRGPGPVAAPGWRGSAQPERGGEARGRAEVSRPAPRGGGEARGAVIAPRGGGGDRGGGAPRPAPRAGGGGGGRGERGPRQ